MCIEGLLDGGAAGEQAVIAHDHRVVRPEIAHQPFALVRFDRRPFIVVVADMTDEADRGLRQRKEAGFHRRDRHARAVCVCKMQATSGLALWMAPWIT